MRRDDVYKIVNILTISVSLVLIFRLNSLYYLALLFSNANTILLLVFFMILLFIVHLIKLFRFYLLFINNRIALRRFAIQYIKTTFVNIILPFKLGEFFRMYCYGREARSWKIGILGVVVDRYFDTVALLLLLLPVEIFILKQISTVSIVLVVFLLIITSVFLTYPTIYFYLNNRLILTSESPYTIRVLSVLEQINEWCVEIRQLIHDRVSILVILSFVAWLIEYLMVYLLSRIYGLEYSVSTFKQYITAVFNGQHNDYISIYVWAGSVIFALSTLIIYGTMIFRLRRLSHE